jgi:hypothetical protein
MLSFLWTIVIGFIAGVIAKLITRGSEYEPKGFVLTTLNGTRTSSVRRASPRSRAQNTEAGPVFWLLSAEQLSRYRFR